MGTMIDGDWHKERQFPTQDGDFKRSETTFRGKVTADGAGGFKAEAGRYHLYVSLACPWAHRTLIMRRLKGLQDAVTLSIVDPVMGEEGWTFSDGPGCIPDTVNGAEHLRDIYTLADPGYTGRVTVPVLWDKETRTIVNNESADIIRLLNGPFAALGSNGHDYHPAHLRNEIHAINETVYENVNNGVYRAGFATTQEAYERAFDALFETLDMLEERLDSQRYLAGDTLTEADWRLFTTLVRFDPVYHGHFKCNRQRIVDYFNLWDYLRELYQVPGVAETVDFRHIKTHYYVSHRSINPTGIVPRGPDLDLSAPHGRAAVG